MELRKDAKVKHLTKSVCEQLHIHKQIDKVNAENAYQNHLNAAMNKISFGKRIRKKKNPNSIIQT